MLKTQMDLTIKFQKEMEAIYKEEGLPIENTETTIEFLENFAKAKIIDGILTSKEAGEEAKIRATNQNIYAQSVVYFDTNNNYGISAEKNLCNTPEMQNHKKEFGNNFTCATSKTYPSKSFTITNKSTTEDGFYCVDQKGFVGLLLNKNNQFVSGVKCK
jgi:hypothetical protein